MADCHTASRRELYDHCPLCESLSLTDLYDVSSFTIARCESCSLVFVRDVMNSDSLRPYYESQVDQVYSDPENVENLNYYYEKLKSVICQMVPQGGRLLDVGCSEGQFLDVMGEHWERHGIELSPVSAAVARRTHGDRIHEGVLADFPGATGCYDVVTLLDVLDHSPDPVSDLQTVSRLLRTKGLAVIKVHNISCLWARLAKGKFYAIGPPYHLYYFNRKTLDMALARTGLKLTTAMFMAHRLFLKTVPYRFSRGNVSSWQYRLYSLLSRSRVGRIPIYKNLHDIITVLAVKL